VRILFLSQRLPYAANRGDRIRAFHMLKYLGGRADVDLVSLVHDDEEMARVSEVEPLVASVTAIPLPALARHARSGAAMFTGRALTHAILCPPAAVAACREAVRRHRPDFVFAYCSGVAPLALQPELADIPLVLDLVDVDSAKWAALGETARFPMSSIYRREAHRLGQFEALVSARAHSVLVVNERERDLLSAVVPHVTPTVIENGVDFDLFRSPHPPAEGSRVVFCGVMDYQPNVDAVLWFAREVWPRVRRQRPDATFTIVGSSPARAVAALHGREGIEVTGAVTDTRPFLWDAAVSVAPIAVARGIQNKVLEAVSAGLPCVVTPAVHSGLPPDIQPACVVASDPSAFAESVVALIDLPPKDRRIIAEMANLEPLSWRRRLAPLGTVMEAAARAGKAARDVSPAIAAIQPA
jgi:polysaccharide biosynthesis protein PslH